MSNLQYSKTLHAEIFNTILTIATLEETIDRSTSALKKTTRRYQGLLEVEKPSLSEAEEEEMRTFKKNFEVLKTLRLHNPGFDVVPYFMKHGFVTPKQAQVLVRTLWKIGDRSTPATSYPKVCGTRGDFESIAEDVRNFLAPVSSVSGEPLLKEG